MLDDILGHVRYFQAEIFLSRHRGVQVEILDIHCEPFCSWCQDYAVDEELYGEEVGCRRSYVTWEFDSVAPCCQSHSVGLRFSLSIVAIDFSVSHVSESVSWDLMLVDEVYGVRPVDSSWHSLGEAADFVAVTVAPNLFVFIPFH